MTNFLNHGDVLTNLWGRFDQFGDVLTRGRFDCNPFRVSSLEKNNNTEMMVNIRNIDLKSVDISSNEYNYNISFSYSALSIFPSSIRMKLTLYFSVKYISNLFKTCIHMPVSRTFERVIARHRLRIAIPALRFDTYLDVLVSFSINCLDFAKAFDKMPHRTGPAQLRFLGSLPRANDPIITGMDRNAQETGLRNA